MRLVDADKFLERVKKDREHEIYLHSWTADMVLKRLDSWYAPTVEAIPKDQYEARLKADLVAILTEIQLEIEEIEEFTNTVGWELRAKAPEEIKKECSELIQQKINALKAEAEDQDGQTND